MNMPMTVAVVAVVFFWIGGRRDVALEIAALAAVVYFAQVFVFHLITCGRCGGKGKLDNPFGAGHRPCKKCGRKGEHVRWGRRMWDKRVSGG